MQFPMRYEDLSEEISVILLQIISPFDVYLFDETNWPRALFFRRDISPALLVIESVCATYVLIN